MQIRFWYHFFEGCDSTAVKDEIHKILADANINLYQLDSKKVSGPGIVFFNGISEELYDFIREISHNGVQRILIINISGSPLNNCNIWTLLQVGASDVLVWNESLDCKMIKEKLERWNTVEKLIESPLVYKNLVGQSPAWRFALRETLEVAYFSNASILITGESGTGKELVARLIHTLDQRSDKGKLVILDCTTVVPELSGSEFFGHERGSFTSAVAARTGAFELADKGTLFLDEVGELPLNLQAQLLRVVQEHTYKRVGGNSWHNTDFRLVCATNKDLEKEVESGKFRRDLYYRIADWTCRLPPLRERSEDILLLARHFLRELWPDGKPPDLDESVCQYLLTRDYPGNVRDLKHLISRISYFHAGSGPITIGNIPKEEISLMNQEHKGWWDEHLESNLRRALSLGIGLKQIRHDIEKNIIKIAIEEEDTLKNAACKLKITERALQMRRASIRSNNEHQEVTQMENGYTETQPAYHVQN